MDGQTDGRTDRQTDRERERGEEREMRGQMPISYKLARLVYNVKHVLVPWAGVKKTVSD